MSDNATLVERLEGPHEWGYRDITDGRFVADDTPYEAAEEICNQATEIGRTATFWSGECAKATARIAELEAERHSWREANDRVWRALPKNLPGDEPGIIDAAVHVAWMTARIAELEAELSGVKAIVDWNREQNEQLRDRIAVLGAERDYNRTAHDSAIKRIAELTAALAAYDRAAMGEVK